jgi:hypothetical protein
VLKFGFFILIKRLYFLEMDSKKASLTREEVEKAFDLCDNTRTGFIAIKRLKAGFFIIELKFSRISMFLDCYAKYGIRAAPK